VSKTGSLLNILTEFVLLRKLTHPSTAAWDSQADFSVALRNSACSILGLKEVGIGLEYIVKGVASTPCLVYFSGTSFSLPTYPVCLLSPTPFVTARIIKEIQLVLKKIYCLVLICFTSLQMSFLLPFKMDLSTCTAIRIFSETGRRK